MKIMKALDKKNLQTQKLISELYRLSKDKKKEVYAVIAKSLMAPTRKINAVNFFKLQKSSHVVDGDIIVIPGKLLAVGTLEKKITIYANGFSESAKAKFKNIKLLSDLIKDNVDYKKIKLIK
jgi:large subunit ribosomal protein L18e